MNYWRAWRYKNLTLLSLGIAAAVFLFSNQSFHTFLLNLKEAGYVGVFIAGMLFVSTFTVGAGAVILLVLAQKISPLQVAIIGGLGAVFTDLLIFRFVKDNLLEEVKPIYEALGGNHLTHVLHTKYFSWTLPVIGAIIIASPLPDELGVSLMGIAKMEIKQFAIVSFLLNMIGIFLVVFLSNMIAA